MSAVTLSKTDYTKLLHSHLIRQSEDVIKKINGLTRSREFCDYLKKNDIDYQLCIKHPEVLGCDESELYYQRFNEYLQFNYSIFKHILVKERKGEKRVYLIIVDKDKKVDLSKLKEDLDCKKLEFVSQDEMEELISTTPGNISVFNLIQDKYKKINLILDYELLDKESLAFHPLYNGMTLFIEPKEVSKFLGVIDKQPTVMDIPVKEELGKVKNYV